MCLHHNAEHICIVGDMNTDISRSHSRHTRLLLQFVENEQLYLALNFSDKNVKYHSPLCLCLNIDSRKFECNGFKFKPCKKWSSITPAHISTYQCTLDEFLYNIVLPYDCFNCANLLCTNIIHTNSIQILHDQIILALLI